MLLCLSMWSFAYTWFTWRNDLARLLLGICWCNHRILWGWESDSYHKQSTLSSDWIMAHTKYIPKLDGVLWACTLHVKMQDRGKCHRLSSVRTKDQWFVEHLNVSAVSSRCIKGMFTRSVHSVVIGIIRKTFSSHAQLKLMICSQRVNVISVIGMPSFRQLKCFSLSLDGYVGTCA